MLCIYIQRILINNHALLFADHSFPILFQLICVINIFNNVKLF